MKNLLFLSILFFPILLFGQDQICGNSLLEALQERELPGYKDVITQTILDAKSSVTYRDGDTLTIPVVIHILYNNDAQNLSDNVINTQMEALNADFLRENENAFETRPIFQDVAGTANIEFKLADIDPNGNSTNGITRTQTSVQSFINIDIAAYFEAIIACGVDLFDPESLAENIECITEFVNLELDLMKSSATGGIEAWDVNRYLNIWVCNMSVDIGGTESPFILGYAYPPVEAPNWPDGTIPEDIEQKDGVVIHYEAIGPNNPSNMTLLGTNDQGRTATHEVGHYLGLRHIWGDGDCTMDDFMDDTPVADSNSQAAGMTCAELHTKDSCTEDDLPDMIENYMDYSVETCYNMFTQDQVDLMRAMLEGPRSSLLEGAVLSSDEDRGDQYSLYPTLTDAKVTIKGDLSIGMILTITDIQGRMVYLGDIDTPSIDLSEYNDGLYIIQLQSDNRNVHTSKVMKF